MSESVSLSGSAYAEYSAEGSAGLLLQGIYLRRPTQQAYYVKHGFVQYVPLDTARCTVGKGEPIEFHYPSPATFAIQTVQRLEAEGQLEEGSTQSAVESVRNMSFEDSEWAKYAPGTDASL